MKRINDKSFFIIKPEAFYLRDEIKKEITTQSDLIILDSKTVILTKEDIDILYSYDVRTELMKVIRFWLIGSMVEVGIVGGNDVVKKLIKICGESPFPIDCSDNTIRKKFGRREPIVCGGVIYYLNAIHKADEGEIIKSLEWFKKIKG